MISVPPWPPRSIDGGPALHRPQAARGTTSQRRPPAPGPQAPQPPPPESAIPVQGHHSAVLQGQEHHGGWGLDGRCPKIEIELQWGEDRGRLARAGWGRETGSETGLGTWRGSPWEAGWALISLQVGIRLRDTGAGGASTSNRKPSLPSPGPSRDGQNWGGTQGATSGTGPAAGGVGRAESSKNILR